MYSQQLHVTHSGGITSSTTHRKWTQEYHITCNLLIILWTTRIEISYRHKKSRWNTTTTILIHSMIYTVMKILNLRNVLRFPNNSDLNICTGFSIDSLAREFRLCYLLPLNVPLHWRTQKFDTYIFNVTRFNDYIICIFSLVFIWQHNQKIKVRKMTK